MCKEVENRKPLLQLGCCVVWGPFWQKLYANTKQQEASLFSSLPASLQLLAVLRARQVAKSPHNRSFNSASLELRNDGPTIRTALITPQKEMKRKNHIAKEV